MTVPAAQRENGEESECVELPGTDAAQRALHEATGHLYDELAIADEADTAQLPADVFTALEELYVATAEESVTNVRISYETKER